MWEQINENGFGNESNRYAWSMAVFNDELYVGTMNLNGPKEGLLYYLDIYLPGMSRGCEIWKYTPAGGWSLVVEAGIDGDLANFGIRNMIVFRGSLYCGTVNQRTGFEMWRTSDGVSWERVGSDGFGDPASISARAMHIYNGCLYLGIENRKSGAAVYRTQDGQTWETVLQGGFGNRLNSSVHSLATFQGRLYAGVRNYSQGFSIWCSEDGVSFQPVISGGFGDRLNQAVMAMNPFHSHFFVGTASMPRGTELLATDGTQWQRVGDRGLGDSRNLYTWSMQEFQGRLYLGTYKLPASGYTGENGFDLYSSRDGFNWDVITRQGFEDAGNYGARTMAVMDGVLYLGTANLLAGCQVWRGYD